MDFMFYFVSVFIYSFIYSLRKSFIFLGFIIFLSMYSYIHLFIYFVRVSLFVLSEKRVRMLIKYPR